MALQHLPTIVEYNKNGSLLIQPISDNQASILDLVLFLGFTRISTAIQEHLTLDLNLYVPLLCMFGLLVFVYKHIYECLLG